MIKYFYLAFFIPLLSVLVSLLSKSFNFELATIFYFFLIGFFVVYPNKYFFFSLILINFFELLNFELMNDFLNINYTFNKISIITKFEITVIMIFSLFCFIFTCIYLLNKFIYLNFNFSALKTNLDIFDMIFILYLIFIPFVIYGGYLGLISNNINPTFGLRGYLLLSIFFWARVYLKPLNLNSNEYIKMVRVVSYIFLIVIIFKLIHGIHWTLGLPLTLSLPLISLYEKKYTRLFIEIILLGLIFYLIPFQLTTILAMLFFLFFIFFAFFNKNYLKKIIYFLCISFIFLPIFTLLIIDMDDYFFKEYMTKTDWEQIYDYQNMDTFKGVSGTFERIVYKIYSDRLIIYNGAFNKILEGEILPANGRSYALFHPHWKAVSWHAGAHHLLLQSVFELGPITGTMYLVLFFYLMICFLNLFYFQKLSNLKILSFGLFCTLVCGNGLNQLLFWDFSGGIILLLLGLLFYANEKKLRENV